MSDSGRTLNSQPMGADYWKDWYYKEFQTRCGYMEEVERLKAETPPSFYKDLMSENSRLRERNTELAKENGELKSISSLRGMLDENKKLKEENRNLLNTIDSFREKLSNLSAMLEE